MILPALICFAIVLVGFYGLVFSQDIIKSIMSLSIIEAAIILILIFLTRESGTGLAILGLDNLVPVDPAPQAFMITAIVIGASITALALMISVKLFHYYGTLKWDELLERID